MGFGAIEGRGRRIARTQEIMRTLSLSLSLSLPLPLPPSLPLTPLPPPLTWVFSHRPLPSDHRCCRNVSRIGDLLSSLCQCLAPIFWGLQPPSLPRSLPPVLPPASLRILKPAIVICLSFCCVLSLSLSLTHSTHVQGGEQALKYLSHIWEEVAAVYEVCVCAHFSDARKNARRCAPRIHFGLLLSRGYEGKERMKMSDENALKEREKKKDENVR